MLKTLLFLIGSFFLFELLDEYLLFPRFEISLPKSFTGTEFYNPYQNQNFSNLLLGNFHGHTKAWGGLTNGKANPKTSQRRYDSLGYELSNLSQYQFLDEASQGNNSLQVYEHGINLNKNDLEYLESNFMNFFNAINVSELLDFFKKGIVHKKNFNNIFI